MKIGTFAKPGPGFFSFLSGLAVGLFAVIILFKSWFSKNLLEKISKGKISWKPLALTFGSLVGFTLFLRTLGFNITTFLLIGFLLRAVEKKNWIVSVFVALSVTLGAYLLFEVFLQSQLPQGPLGF